MDKRIRRNELCIVGLPRCDFVFSATRTCFIGYGFHESALEMSILRHLLSQQGIEAVEAGGTLAPGQNAFCTKICSKIITSQFCIILLNNDLRDDTEVPNANVNMEYGLMLGFNKYVIPFQRNSQQLPFNVSGLDTIKYTNENFEHKATQAIEVAIKATTQDAAPYFSPDQILESFLLSKRVMIVPLLTDGDRNLYELGRALGFNMLMTFDGICYLYFGNFTTLRPETVLWRLRTLEEIISERFGSMHQRTQLGVPLDVRQKAALEIFLKNLKIWLLVTGDDDKTKVEEALSQKSSIWPVQVFTLKDIISALQAIG